MKEEVGRSHFFFNCSFYIFECYLNGDRYDYIKSPEVGFVQLLDLGTFGRLSRV